MPGGPSLIYEFVSEAKEHLANVGDDLLALERRQDDSSRYRINRLFRAVHSIKGGAGFFGCRVIEELAHAMENVLDHWREQPAAPNYQVIDTLLAGTDRMAALLDDVERSNEADIVALLLRLRELLPDRADGGAATSAWVQSPVMAPEDANALLPIPVLAKRPAREAYVFGLTFDLRACEREQGLSPGEVLERVQEAGTILNARVDVPEEDFNASFSRGEVVYRAIVSSARQSSGRRGGGPCGERLFIGRSSPPHCRWMSLPSHSDCPGRALRFSKSQSRQRNAQRRARRSPRRSRRDRPIAAAPSAFRCRWWTGSLRWRAN
jgi:HPt (histidine-containing phosphotransfer) domain-containing protein